MLNLAFSLDWLARWRRCVDKLTVQSNTKGLESILMVLLSLSLYFVYQYLFYGSTWMNSLY